MTTFRKPDLDPGFVNVQRFARNGMVASGPLQRLVSSGQNYVYANRRKAFSRAHPATALAIPAGTSGTKDWAWGHIKTGYGCTTVAAILGMLPPNSASATKPEAWIELDDGGGTITGTSAFYPKSVISSSKNATFWHFGYSFATGVSENTDYEVTIKVSDYATLFCYMVWEVPDLPIDDTNTGAVDPNGQHRDKPILDSYTQDMVDGIDSLWDANARTLLHWSAATTSFGKSVTGTTWTNILDTSVTTYSANTPGFKLDLANCGPVAINQCEVDGTVRGERTAGTSTGEFRLYNGSTAIALSTNITTAGFYDLATFQPTATDNQKWDLQARGGDPVTEVRIDAVNLWLIGA